MPGVKSVELFAEQQEVVFLEISRPRLAQLGINEDQIYAKLQERNIAADGGRIRVGDQHVPLDPTGEFSSVEDMLGLVIGSDQFRPAAIPARRGDGRARRPRSSPAAAPLRRQAGDWPGHLDGSRRQRRRNGREVRKKLAEIERNQPVGIEIGEINFQPEAVSAATNEFMKNLLKAVSIVVIVLLLAMGWRTGLIIGAVLFITIMGTFFVMFMHGDILMERISLGALIIALCMLTDNAIIVIEGVEGRYRVWQEQIGCCA